MTRKPLDKWTGNPSRYLPGEILVLIVGKFHFKDIFQILQKKYENAKGKTFFVGFQQLKSTGKKNPQNFSQLLWVRRPEKFTGGDICERQGILWGIFFIAPIPWDRVKQAFRTLPRVLFGTNVFQQYDNFWRKVLMKTVSSLFLIGRISVSWLARVRTQFPDATATFPSPLAW